MPPNHKPSPATLVGLHLRLSQQCGDDEAARPAGPPPPPRQPLYNQPDSLATEDSAGGTASLPNSSPPHADRLAGRPSARPSVAVATTGISRASTAATPASSCAATHQPRPHLPRTNPPPLEALTRSSPHVPARRSPLSSDPLFTFPNKDRGERLVIPNWIAFSAVDKVNQDCEMLEHLFPIISVNFKPRTQSCLPGDYSCGGQATGVEFPFSFGIREESSYKVYLFSGSERCAS